jgi:GNAT superfamily N-acetyltransferase
MTAPPFSPPFADLEAIERDAWVDLFAAATDPVRQSLGLACKRIDDGALLICRGIDHIQFNRLAALGLGAPARAETVDHAVAEFDRAGLKNWIVQVPEQAVGLAEICTGRGLRPHPRAWVKFRRAATPFEAATRLTVRAADPAEARPFGATAAAAFGMPAMVGDWLARLVGRPRWHCLLALDGGQPVAAGALFADSGYAWLGIGGTLSSHRRFGAQSALLAARIAKAAELGCTWLTTETGLPQPGEAGPSYRNIQRAGFEIAYVRPNLTRAG